MSGYPDYPECLLRYSWLVEESDGRNLFTAEPYSRCKACGLLVPLVGHERHRDDELRQLAAVREQRARAVRREGAARLRTLNRHRRETATCL